MEFTVSGWTPLIACSRPKMSVSTSRDLTFPEFPQYVISFQFLPLLALPRTVRMCGWVMDGFWQLGMDGWIDMMKLMDESMDAKIHLTRDICLFANISMESRSLHRHKLLFQAQT